MNVLSAVRNISLDIEWLTVKIDHDRTSMVFRRIQRHSCLCGYAST